jgi:hypothetical protein
VASLDFIFFSLLLFSSFDSQHKSELTSLLMYKVASLLFFHHHVNERLYRCFPLCCPTRRLTSLANKGINYVLTKSASLLPGWVNQSPSNFVTLFQTFQSLTSILPIEALTTSLISRSLFRSHSFALSLSLVENIGFEPMTPCLQSRCSSQLS